MKLDTSETREYQLTFTLSKAEVEFFINILEYATKIGIISCFKGVRNQLHEMINPATYVPFNNENQPLTKKAT